MNLDNYIVELTEPGGDKVMRHIVAPSAVVAYNIIYQILAVVPDWRVDYVKGPVDDATIIAMKG